MYFNLSYDNVQSKTYTTNLIVMYENNDTKKQQIFLGKKFNDCDDEGPISKKAQRNKWKKDNKKRQDQGELFQYQNQNNKKVEQKPQPKKAPVSKQQKQDLMVTQIKTMVDCSQGLIRKCLTQCNYNMQDTINLIFQKQQKGESDMLDVFDSKPQQIKNSSKKSSQNSQTHPRTKSKYEPNQTQEQGYKLLNDIYEKAAIEITGFEFEELFDEITEIIRQDQKQKGRAQLQINSLVDTCNNAKDAVIIGLKDLFKIGDEIQFDENDPAVRQVQNFIENLAKKQRQQDVIKKSQFPTLGQSNTKKNVKANKKQQPIKRSIVNQLQDQKKYTNGPLRKQDLFVPSNNRPIVFQKNNKGIFNIDNQQESEDALKELHKEYGHVSIHTLIMVYSMLEKNFSLTRTFLSQYYAQDKFQRKVQIESRSSRRQQVQPARRHIILGFRKETFEDIDKQLQNWSYSQLRAEIEHLYNLRQVFHMTLNKITNANQRKQLMRIADERAPASLIRKLSKASRVLLIEQSMMGNPHYIDLHGYRQEEVHPILESMVASMRDNFERGNERIKYRSVGGKVEAVLQVMTGKGRHSHHGQSVLKPCIKQWCDQHGIKYISNDDNVEIFIPLV